MNRATDPRPRSLLVLTASFELGGVAERLAETVSEPDPDTITAIAQQLRDIAAMLDAGNATQLRRV